MTTLSRRSPALALGLALLALPARGQVQLAPVPASDPPAGALTLDQALALARQGNEVSGVAQARVERAQALRQQAVAQLIPSLSLNGTYTRRAREVTREVGGDEVVVQALDAYSGQAVVDSVLFDLRAVPLLRAATRSVEAQKLESAELERTLAFDVADTFFTALGTDALLAAAERRVRVAEQTVEESKLRLEAGLANRNDLTRAELELATARLTATRAARDTDAARLALSYLIAAPVDRPLAAPAELAAPAGETSALVDQALARRNEIAALAERAEAARQAAIAPRLGIVPTLDLRGTYRWTNEAGLSGREEDWNVALLFGWSIWDGGDRSATAAARDADYREATLALSDRRRRVALEVEQALADLAAADAAYTQAEAQLSAASQNADEVRERYRAGLATALEQADAAVSQFEAEAETARQGFLRAVTRLNVERAIGAWPLADSQPQDEPPAPAEETPTP